MIKILVVFVGAVVACAVAGGIGYLLGGWCYELDEKWDRWSVRRGKR